MSVWPSWQVLQLRTVKSRVRLSGNIIFRLRLHQLSRHESVLRCCAPRSRFLLPPGMSPTGRFVDSFLFSCFEREGCNVGILCHVTRLIHGCHVTRFHMWHDSFIRVTWVIPLQVNSRHQAAVNLQQQVVFQWRHFRKSIKWVMTNIRMSHVTHMNESCHTYEWIMSHIWMKMMMIALIITLGKIM